jgi:hypothetical protein
MEGLRLQVVEPLTFNDIYRSTICAEVLVYKVLFGFWWRASCPVPADLQETVGEPGQPVSARERVDYILAQTCPAVPPRSDGVGVATAAQQCDRSVGRSNVSASIGAEQQSGRGRAIRLTGLAAPPGDS